MNDILDKVLELLIWLDAVLLVIAVIAGVVGYQINRRMKEEIHRLEKIRNERTGSPA